MHMNERLLSIRVLAEVEGGTTSVCTSTDSSTVTAIGWDIARGNPRSRGEKNEVRSCWPHKTQKLRLLLGTPSPAASWPLLR